jgi:hypothetical protein
MERPEDRTQIPLPVISAENMQACEEHGECCHCGACCTLFRIPGIPRVGPDGPGSVRKFFGLFVLKSTKRFGERCGHLLETLQGKTSCALHGTKYRPPVCRQWTGNTVVRKARDEDDVDILAMYFLHENALVALRNPPNTATVDELRRLCRTGALRSLIHWPAVSDAEELHMFLRRWILELEIIDDGLFSIAKVPEALQRCTQEELRRLRSLFDLSRITHYTFVTRFIDPCFAEASKERK